MGTGVEKTLREKSSESVQNILLLTVYRTVCTPSLARSIPPSPSPLATPPPSPTITMGYNLIYPPSPTTVEHQLRQAGKHTRRVSAYGNSSTTHYCIHNVTIPFGPVVCMCGLGSPHCGNGVWPWILIILIGSPACFGVLNDFIDLDSTLLLGFKSTQHYNK